MTQTEWLGAIIKNIETLGEQSASGSPDKKGVLILTVAPGSLAAKSGLQAGDIIRSVNEEGITDVNAFIAKIQSVNWQGTATAVVLHNQQLIKRQLILN
jgi:S1-C subfamily serine protease